MNANCTSIANNDITLFGTVRVNPSAGTTAVALGSKLRSDLVRGGGEGGTAKDPRVSDHRSRAVLFTREACERTYFWIYFIVDRCSFSCFVPRQLKEPASWKAGRRVNERAMRTVFSSRAASTGRLHLGRRDEELSRACGSACSRFEITRSDSKMVLMVVVMGGGDSGLGVAHNPIRGSFRARRCFHGLAHRFFLVDGRIRDPNIKERDARFVN